jgi:hypothetical protein
MNLYYKTFILGDVTSKALGILKKYSNSKPLENFPIFSE